eukprot:TRINITY_DN10224_c0_g1_i1.p1 TRINITY_DN10224_c0_g1~~TRINITY_DN10224_c0_g1_i1.p1  ORF type:complete len:339 (+),score=51.60 TRINITY_DN10224_c0_g1_i1:64-1017(+)
MRIPVDHLNSEGLSWLVENNVFIGGAAGCLLLAWILAVKKYSRVRFIAALASLGVGFLVATIAIEHYYASECPIASEKMVATYRILRENTRFWTTQTEEWNNNHPHFLADGTLLVVVRKYKGLMPWDQDTDYYLQYDTEQDPDAAELVKKLRDFHAKDLEVVYHPERHLVQIRHSSGGHGDIWLWSKKDIGGVTCLYNPDFTYQHFKIPGCNRYEWIVPTKTIDWKVGAESLKVEIPNDTPAFLTNLFGPRYMEPYRSRMQCTENFAVHAGSQWRYGYVALALLAMFYSYKFFSAYLEHRRSLLMMLPLWARGQPIR